MMKMLRREVVVPALLLWLGAGLLAAVLWGCASLTSQTPSQKIATGYATAEGINASTTALLKAKRISSADAENVREATRAAVRGLDIAKGLLGKDPKSAEFKAQAARETLKAHEAYLKSKEAK